jgi:lupus La protein
MWEQTGGWENRPVKLKKICTFGRMRRFEPYEAIVAALKESQFLNVSGPEGDEELTRKTAYVSNSKPYAKKEAATVYIKGFGEEEPDTQFKIEAMLAQCGQTVRSIRLRRTEEDVFKGSVFVEFDDEEQATAFLALDPKPQFEGNDLKIMSKKDYVEEKNQLIKEGKMEPSKSRKVRFWEGKEIGGSRDNFHGRGRGRGRGDFRGSRTDSDDWKKRREEDQQNGFRRNDRDSRGRGRGRGRGGRGGRGRGGRDNNRRDDRDGRSNRNTNE